MSDLKQIDGQHFHVDYYAKVSEKFVRALLMKQNDLCEWEWSAEASMCGVVRAKSVDPRHEKTETQDVSASVSVETVPPEHGHENADEKAIAARLRVVV